MRPDHVTCQEILVDKDIILSGLYGIYLELNWQLGSLNFIIHVCAYKLSLGVFFNFIFVMSRRIGRTVNQHCIQKKLM